MKSTPRAVPVPAEMRELADQIAEEGKSIPIQDLDSVRASLYVAATHIEAQAAQLAEIEREREQLRAFIPHVLPPHAFSTCPGTDRHRNCARCALDGIAAALSTSPDKEERKLKSNCPFCGAREGGWHKESCRLTSDNSDQPNREET